MGMKTQHRLHGRNRNCTTRQPEGNLQDAEGTELYQAIGFSDVPWGPATRFDIIYALSQLARTMSKPGKIYMTAAKHLLSTTLYAVRG